MSHMNTMTDDTVYTYTSCEICGTKTQFLGTKRCDRCYELESRITKDPVLAFKILRSNAVMETARRAGKSIYNELYSISNQNETLKKSAEIDKKSIDTLAKSVSHWKDKAELFQLTSEHSAEVIDRYIKRVEALTKEVNHWKANHNDLKKRLAMAQQRPDLPTDRIPMYEELCATIETLSDALNYNRDKVVEKETIIKELKCQLS